MTTGNERVSWTYFTLHEIYGAWNPVEAFRVEARILLFLAVPCISLFSTYYTQRC
jgi:hypothetical protein